MKHISPNRSTVILLAALINTLISASLNNNANTAEIDFDTEVVPLLSKAGCNAASCHGGAAGQAGFRLSLFGGDPELDHRTIVRELFGRRVNHTRPNKSLIISKPTEQLDHGGGQVLDPEGEIAQTLTNWIAAGCHRLQLRKLDRLQVDPPEFGADAVPATVQFRVTAVFDDGLKRDVTKQAVYVSQNEPALVVDELGMATVTSPGQHSASVRFAGQVAMVSFTTPIGSIAVAFPESATNNWVDDELNETLKRLRLATAPTTDDASFLRRLSLDLAGRLPTTDQVESFLHDDEASKRSRLIDELIDSSQFVDYWTHRLAMQLRLRTPGKDTLAADAFYHWLRDCVANDTGWDEIANALILSEGDSHQNGAATVHRLFTTARQEAEYMSEVLMGVRLRCANCHNHPLDHWTQDDYHGLAAIFAGFERNQVVRFNGRGTVMHPRTGISAVPRIPGERFVTKNSDARREFSHWLTRDANPYFAKAMVGHVWQTLMGRGLVTPVDDLRETNPASHPKLVNRLSTFFTENDFKLRPLIRLICQSAAYQRSASPPEIGPIDSPDQFYSRAIIKPLSAEVLADAIGDVTGVADDYGGVRRAINVVDRASSSDRLQFLGQCLPSENCSASSGSGRGIASKLHLMNGELLNAKIINSDGRLQQMLGNHVATDDLVGEFFVRALCRPPSERELTDWVDRIDASEDQQKHERCEDFLWALLNCHEFTNSH